MTRLEKVRIGEVLVKQNLLTEQQVDTALEHQKKHGGRLGRILVELGLVTGDVLAKALAHQLKIPYVSLKSFNFSTEVVHKITEAQARRLGALVLEDRGATYRVGMVDPTDLFAYDTLGRLLKRDLDPCVITERDFLANADRLYRRTGEITGHAEELTAEMGSAPLEFGEILGPMAGQEDAPVVKLLQTVFEEAIKMRASDIHFEPQDRLLRIRFRIDGVLHLQAESDLKIASAVALRLKLVSGLDISEKRLPQDGRFNFKAGRQTVDVRLSTMPTQYGESVVMRLLNQSTGLLGLDRLGMPPAVLERIRHVVHRSSGMILATGPTGSGKTTTLYAALSEINSDEVKIITVEDPVEYRLPMINQVQVHEKIDLGFERVLRSALRQDPDVILIGEMRDQMTAEIGMRAAMTGHMVLSTLHTNDAVSTPIRLIDMGVPRYMMALSLRLVIAQRLVRVVCENCAQPYQPSATELAWLKAELGAQVAGHRYMHGAGCSYCNGTGYQGRTGIYEMLEMTSAVVEAANQPDPAAFVRAARAQMAGQTLRRDAVRLVTSGRTTVAEAMLVGNEFED